MYRRAVVAVGVVVAILSFMVSCDRGQTRRERSEQAPSSATVRLKWLHQAQFAGFYVAEQTNLYRDAGLKVALLPGGTDFPSIQAVAGGDEQFGVSGGDQILKARDKGVPVVALAVIFQENPMVYFSMEDSGIRTPQDFVGKRVGVKVGQAEELIYRAMLRSAGVDTKEITEIPVKYDMSLFFAGKVDVWPGYEINEAILAEEKGYKLNRIRPSDYGVRLYGDTLFTTETMITQHPELVEKFVDATLRGWKYAIEHPEEAVTHTLKYGDRLQQDHERRMLQASIPLIRPNDKPIGWMDREKWQEMAKFLFNQRFLDNQVEVDEAFTTAFLENRGEVVPEEE